MNQDLTDVLHRIRAKRNFNPAEWIAKKSAMLNEYMLKGGLSGCVVSLSGGVDSSCTLALLLHAQKQYGSPIKKVLAIAQPIHSTKSIQDRAYEVAAALGAEIITVDQSSLHTQLSGIVTQALGVKGTPFADVS
jgi:NAD+ synthase (glutamine-hydrolysing)